MPTATAEKLPMRTIASLTGVNPITLRAWERRYGLVHPLQTPKGHRLYTHELVEQIQSSTGERVLVVLAPGGGGAVIPYSTG